MLGLALAGLALRLVLDALFGTNGDLVRMERAGGWLAETPLDVYVLQRPHGLGLEWPYLPGAFPLIWIAHELAAATGKHFETIQRLGPIAANVALVWVVDVGLRRSRRPGRERVAAAAVLALGPVLVLESAWHGQIDLIATLFATAAVVVWERGTGPRRALAAGALVGAAAAVKTPLGVVLLALLPLAGSRREALALLAGAGGVVLAVCAPWLARDAGALLHGAFSYHGLPGVAGLNLLVQPELAQRWLTGRPVAASGATATLDDLALPLAVAGLAIAFALIAARRPPAAAGAALVLLAGYATGVNLATHYVVWVIPFLLLCGWTRVSVALQAALVVPLAMLYWPSIDGTLATPAAPWSAAWSNLVYVPWMIGLWLASVAGAVVIARRSSRAHSTTMPSQASWIRTQ